jgi:hypothetical protein
VISAGALIHCFYCWDKKKLEFSQLPQMACHCQSQRICLFEVGNFDVGKFDFKTFGYDVLLQWGY